MVTAADRSIDELTSAIKTKVLSLKASVVSDDLIAVYRCGAVLWNNDALDGYAAAYPEIRKFRTVGKPSVAIQVHKNRGAR